MSYPCKATFVYARISTIHEQCGSTALITLKSAAPWTFVFYGAARCTIYYSWRHDRISSYDSLYLSTNVFLSGINASVNRQQFESGGPQVQACIWSCGFQNYQWFTTRMGWRMILRFKFGDNIGITVCGEKVNFALDDLLTMPTHFSQNLFVH